MSHLRPNQHDWQVVAQEHNPYREWVYCPLCNKYKDDQGNLYTKTQFKRITQLHRLFEPDSAVRLIFGKSLV